MLTPTSARTELLDAHEVAALLRVHFQTINGWRVRGEGPRFVKVGTRVRYTRAAIEQWLSEREFKSTADAAHERNDAA